MTNTVIITAKDISKAGDIIDLCVANGANQVNYISFSLSPEKEQAYRNAALKEAVQKTRADADTVAVAAGVNITGVQNVVIGSSMPVPIYDNMMSGGGMAGGGASSVSTPVSPGEIRVSATVTVSYLFS